MQVNKLEHVPFIRSIINLPVINGLLTSFLPSLILRVFLALLPTLLTFMNKVQGMVSTSSIEFGVVSEAVIGAALGLGRFCFGKLVSAWQWRSTNAPETGSPQQLGSWVVLDCMGCGPVKWQLQAIWQRLISPSVAASTPGLQLGSQHRGSLHVG